MANGSIVPTAAMFSCLILYNAASISQSKPGMEVPFEVVDGWILVKAGVEQIKGLTFQIDTGSMSSVIDRRVSKKLRLQTGSQEYRVNAFGKVGRAKKVEITGLHLGRISVDLRCIEADLSALGVDGLIGLDVLRHMNQVVNLETGEAPPRKTLTIDFRAHRIFFGESRELDFVVPLEMDSQIVVNAGIEGHRLRLAVDTGTRISVLYRASQQRWIDKLPIIGYFSGARLMSRYQQQEVRLSSFILGMVACDYMTALVSEARNQPVDGLLSIIQLGPKIIHFDFERTLMTWQR